jgi:dipeptidyl aminopeptidase/acylaminoacyl peptidase
MRCFPRAFLSILCLLVHFNGVKAADTKRGITAEDYFAFKFLSDPQISPDGQQVVYVLTTIDSKKNRRNSSIWEVATDGSGTPRRLSAEGFSSSSPRWSHNGKTLAFLSSRNVDGGTEPPRPQVFLLSMSGGEALPLTSLKNGVSVFQWSPDDTKLVCVGRSGPSDAVAPADRKSDVRHYTHISYKFNDTGWFDDKRSHLWIVHVPSGAAKQITEGDNWNDTDPQWSPDGTRIAFVSNRTGKEYDQDHNTDVWVIPAEGGPLTKISDHLFQDASPRWSPDGKQIVFTGETKRRQFPKLYVASSAGTGPSTLAIDNFDTIPGEMCWGATDHDVLFSAGIKGQTHIFRADLHERKLSQTTSGERAVHAFSFSAPANKMVYLSNDFEHPDELYVSSLDGKEERQLTHANAELWRELDPQPVLRVPYKSTDGWPIDGFLVKPRGWQPGRKYPMILSIHGGPAGQYGTDWYHEFQVYAAKGWAVFFCNPRGSTGYGEKFERGIVNNWGGMDYGDIMAGVDTVLKQNDWIDPNRLGVTGGSYGGYMTNWIVGHTNRFKAAVTLRSVSNFISDDGTRDGAYGHEDDFKGFLFDDFQQYWDASPLKYARSVRTPTLILHSDNDYRVPLEQGEQWFRALKHYGVVSELVIFPRENHNLTRTGEPKHLVESLNWQAWWFRRYLDDGTDAKAPDTQ